MNSKTATLLRSRCLDNTGNVIKKEARALKKAWYTLSKKMKTQERASMLKIGAIK